MGLVGLCRSHSARDCFTDGSGTLRLGDIWSDAVECRCTVPKDSVNISDSCHCNRPSVGAGIYSTPLLLVCSGVVLFHSTMRVEHPNWLILGERTSWTKKVEEHVVRHRRVMPNGVCERGRRSCKALIGVVAPHA